MRKAIRKLHNLRHRSEYFTLKLASRLWILGMYMMGFLNLIWFFIYAAPLIPLSLGAQFLLDFVFEGSSPTEGEPWLVVGLGLIWAAQLSLMLPIAFVGIWYQFQYLSSWIPVYWGLFTLNSKPVNEKKAFLREQLNLPPHETDHPDTARA